MVSFGSPSLSTIRVSSSLEFLLLCPCSTKDWKSHCENSYNHKSTVPSIIVSIIVKFIAHRLNSCRISLLNLTNGKYVDQKQLPALRNDKAIL